jgi:thioredoxin reductase (NADPH)
VANVSEQIRDLIIIGSGPAGYTAAIYTARAQLEPLVFEGSQYGGALMTTTDVENYPGFRDGIMGPDLMEQFRAQAEHFGAELQSKDVTSVELAGDIKRVMVEKTPYLARSVILAMGAQPRYLNVPGEQELLGRGVSSCATCDGFFFRDQDIAVIGGGDSAMEEATFLTRFARSVTVVHRRDEFRASKIMLERARNNDKISWRTGVTIDKVVGDGGVSSLALSDGTTLDVTGMFVAIGHDPRSDLVRGQIDTDEDGYVLVSAPTTETSVAGVFAAGDLVDRTYRQAVTAAGTGCSAAIDAERWLAEHAVDERAQVAAEFVGGGYGTKS